MPAHKSGKKGRKIGRTDRAPATARYKAEGRQLKNKTRKVAKHQKNHPNDLQSTQTCVTIDYKLTKNKNNRTPQAGLSRKA